MTAHPRPRASLLAHSETSSAVSDPPSFGGATGVPELLARRQPEIDGVVVA